MKTYTIRAFDANGTVLAISCAQSVEHASNKFVHKHVSSKGFALRIAGEPGKDGIFQTFVYEPKCNANVSFGNPFHVRED